VPILPRVRGLLLRLAGRDPARRDVDAEVAGYFAMLVDEKIAAGMSPDEARRQARLDMGGVDQVKESVRAARPAAWLDTVARDVRYSLRLLAKAPAFSFTAIVVLALGIGANSAVFGLINLLVFQPAPGADQPGTLVSLHVHDPAKADSYRSFTYAEYEAIRDQSGLFRQLLAHEPIGVSVTDEGETRRVGAALATGTYFDAFGARLVAGRTFTIDEERPGSGAAVLVLSYMAWQRMGGGSDVLGRTLVVNSHRFTVIGIAPKGFAGPVRILGPGFWMPLGAAGLITGRADPALIIVGWLRPGLTLDSANAALGTLSPNLPPAHPAGEGPDRLSAARPSGLDQSMDPSDRGGEELVLPFAALMGAAMVVLMVASLNVANMQLARGASRRKEIALRLALGAGRVGIIRQLLIEGLVLALVGGAAGLLLGVWTMHLVVASLAPMVDETLSVIVAPDWRVCLASLLFSTLAAAVSGLGPAWRISRLDLLPEMRSQEGVGVRGGLHRFGIRNLLVAGQIALSLALLAASGLFVRASVVAGGADPGYRFDRQYLLRLDAKSAGYDAVSGRDAYAALLEHVRAMPGVESAAVASTVAFANEASNRRVWRGHEAPPSESNTPPGPVAWSYDIGGAYFRTLGLPMLRGREFTEAEARDPNATGVAIIDEPLAAALFPGEDPLGQFVQAAGLAGKALRVVGVAPGLRNRLTDRRPVPHLYLPLGPHYYAVSHLHVRAAQGAEPDTLRRRLRDATRSANTRLAVLWIRTLDDARDASPVAWVIRSAGQTFGAFGAIALLMATIGLYGVKAYLVARRTREIGIRMALGAQAADVIRMVVRDGAVLLAAGIAAGFILAIGAGKAVSSLLVGVAPFDPLVLALATAVLSAAVLGACYIPARRASRVVPVTALRVE
jgi:putative ABC transport system permease protein